MIHTCPNGHTLVTVFSKTSPQPPFCLTCLTAWTKSDNSVRGVYTQNGGANNESGGSCVD